MPDYSRGRSRTRRREREYSPSVDSLESDYDRERSAARDGSYRVEKDAVVVRREQTALVPVNYRSSSRYSRRGRRGPSVDTTTTEYVYPAPDAYAYQQRRRGAYSVSPVRPRRRLSRRSRPRSPSVQYSERSYYSYEEDDGGARARDKSRDGWKRPAMVAARAAAVEAFRLRKEPGSWKGAKGARVATVALAAAGLDHHLQKNPNRSTRMAAIESTIGALVVNRLVNGPKRNLRD